MNFSELQSLVDSPQWRSAWNQAYQSLSNSRAAGNCALAVLPDFHQSRYRAKAMPITGITRRGLHLPYAPFVRAEYADAGALLALCNKEIAALKAARWNQLYIPDLLLGAVSPDAWQLLARNLRAQLREVKRECAYRIAGKTLQEYKRSLGAATRKRYFDTAEKLEARADIYFDQVTWRDASAVENFFTCLDRFHLQRWGRACYSPEDRNLLRLLHGALTHDNLGEVQLRRLYAGKELCALVVDVVHGVRVYNFQSGFSAHSPLTKRHPWGSFLLGRAIAEALAQEREYYLLAGSGKHTDYKRHLATHTDTLISFAIERGVLAWARSMLNLYRRLLGR